ncbi:SusC/RagA family TonB-linked outer membrane protein [Parasegetibacter sp. NRK P23]|uniref:SusC/RagA family TonB-linked outer membrane protein n=1 Tax=Parasegetibacter sp. NRK P23 TaxID=2942999 RepID=UPI0020438C00|nr:SusC/RagA family TonB-linked outer membrane protein [Parasegetibacter sp. NRK P23]MCM5530341.1 SusC/RagA family TonB-linked outer membrane protein [Parasegetibacter sp. NRK P23]
MKISTTVSGKKKPVLRLLGTVLLLMLNMMLFAQQKKVTGKVTNPADGKPLQDVNIQVKGTSRGMTTNAKGEFTLTVAENDVLVVSAIGFQTREIRVGNQNNIAIQLVSAANELQNVVVTSLGIKREARSLGYAVTKVDSTQLTDAVSSNWTDALSGKVAGLNLIRSGSGPAGSNKIILRGENNLTGDNEALIVLDGVVISNSGGRRSANSSDNVYGTGSDNMPADYGSVLNDLNAEDIESVTVLKGPGAAALYGQRGANGALIITTKSGKSKKKGHFNVRFNSNGSLESVNRWPDLQYEYGQGLDGAAHYSYGSSVDGASTSGTSSAYGPRFDGQMFFQYDPVTQAVGKERTPWVPYDNLNTFFETGRNLTNSLTIDGKISTTTMRLSLTTQNNTWIIPNTGFERRSINLSTTTDVTKKLKWTNKVNYSHRNSDNLPGAGYGNQSLMYWYIFWQPNADHNWLKNYWANGSRYTLIKYPYSSFPENPYAVVNEFINRSKRNNITANSQALYQFNKDLSLLVRYSIDFANDKRAQERPYDAGTRLPQGSFRTQNIYAQETTVDFLARYNKDVNEDLNLNITVGGSTLKNRYNKIDLRADGLKYPGIYSLDNNLYPIVSIPDTNRYTFNSFYGMFTAGFRDYLYAEVSTRQDWASVLASPYRKANVGFFYPSLSMSFIASQLLNLPKSVNYAKLRASVAKVGSGSTSPYLTAYRYSPITNVLYPDSVFANPSVLPNYDLKPLFTTSLEVGAEVKMFNNRLGFDVALYHQTARGQILSRVIDRSSGHNAVTINAGRVDNKGVEVALNGTLIQAKGRKGFGWMAYATFSSNRNEIISMPDSSVVLRTGPVGGGQIVARPGGSMGDLFGRGYQRAPDGQVIYDATTGLAKITEDVVYLGNTMPKYRASIGNDFKIGQFLLKTLFDAQVGAVAHSLLNYKLVEQGKLKSTLPGRYAGIIGNGVVQNHDGSYRKNDVVAYDIDEYYRSHMGTDNAEGSTFSTDFIKFREASLNYRFTPKFLKKVGLANAQLGIYGRNLFVWSPWPMFDPEFGTLSGTDIVTGFEIAQFPSTRSYGFNLSLGF